MKSDERPGHAGEQQPVPGIGGHEMSEPHGARSAFELRHGNVQIRLAARDRFPERPRARVDGVAHRADLARCASNAIPAIAWSAVIENSATRREAPRVRTSTRA